MITIDQNFFCYNKDRFGGTEYMARYFHENVAKHLLNFKKYNCLIMPGQIDRTYFELINEPKEIILWLHCLVDQFDIKVNHLLTEKRFLSKIKYIITVSEYHKKDVIKKTGIDPNKVIVIYNAITPIENDFSRFKNVDIPQIIYTSSAERGLFVTLKALHELKLNFRLNIFNETIPELLETDDSIKKIINDPRFFFYGKTPHKTVLDHMSKSHIFVHTNIWHETFCISLAEALSANCLCVYSTFGALGEIGNKFGMPYKNENNNDIKNHIKVFSKKISKAIEDVKNNKFNPGTQAQFINNKFSWELFTDSWIKLDKLLEGA